MTEWCLTLRLPRLGQSDCALEELSLGVDDGDEGNGRLENARRQSRETIERFVWRSVEEPCPVHGGQPIQIADDGQQVRPRSAIISPGDRVTVTGAPARDRAICSRRSSAPK